MSASSKRLSQKACRLSVSAPLQSLIQSSAMALTASSWSSGRGSWGARGGEGRWGGGRWGQVGKWRRDIYMRAVPLLKGLAPHVLRGQSGSGESRGVLLRASIGRVTLETRASAGKGLAACVRGRVFAGVCVCVYSVVRERACGWPGAVRSSGAAVPHSS